MSVFRSSIQNFDEGERCVRETDTGYGIKDVNFLTSRGVYRLLYNSNKEISKKFRNWVADILDDIIFNDAKDLTFQIKQKDDALKQKDVALQLKDAELSQKDAKFSIDLTRTKEKTLIESNKKKSVVYCGKVNEDFKFGYSDDIERRVRDHKTDFGAEFTLLFVFESPFYMKIEKMIKKELIDKIYSKEFNGQLKVSTVAQIYYIVLYLSSFLDGILMLLRTYL